MYQANTSWAAGQNVQPADMNRIEAGIAATTTNRGRAPLDSFTGANDDALLTAAMSYAAAQTHPPIIELSNRSHTFNGTRTPYTGFRLEGPGRIANSELGAPNTACQLTVSGSTYWIDNSPGQVYDCFFGGFSALGNSTTGFIGGSNTWSELHMRDLSFHSFQTVLGSQAQSMKLSCCLFDGWWQIQGCYNGAVHVGGSDSRLWMDYGCLADATPSYNTSGNAAGQAHFWFDYMDNTTIGALYITAEGPWQAIHVTGPTYNSSTVPSNCGRIVITGAAIEGRNASQPCYGAVMRVDGGNVRLRDSYLGRAMSSPASMGHTPQDAGYVHVTAGSLNLDGCTWGKYTGQSESVPVVYNNGGTVRCMNNYVEEKGGQWANIPLVTNVGSGTLHTDDTVRTS